MVLLGPGCKLVRREPGKARVRAWLFSDTPAGAHASARLYSLEETAKAAGLDSVRRPQARLHAAAAGCGARRCRDAAAMEHRSRTDAIASVALSTPSSENRPPQAQAGRGALTHQKVRTLLKLEEFRRGRSVSSRLRRRWRSGLGVSMRLSGKRKK